MPGKGKIKTDETKTGVPKTAMVLAAGLGLRLRPITERLPKPLVQVGGKALIDWTLDRLAAVGVERTVVNVHHLGHLVEQHLNKRKAPEIVISSEEELLETGGGVAKALPYLGDTPFVVANSDAIWLNGCQPALKRMSALWDDEKMDALLLLHSVAEAHGYTGDGDFVMDPQGRLERRPEREICPYLFTGTQILHPRLFKDVPEGAFSLNLLYGRAIEAGRLFGMAHDDEWFHIGTPDGLAEAEDFMRVRYAGRQRRST